MAQKHPNSIEKYVIKYKGEFANGQRYGHGRIKYANGDTFTGNWVANKRHGNGKLRKVKAKLIYTGEWKNDRYINGKTKNMKKFKSKKKKKQNQTDPFMMYDMSQRISANMTKNKSD